MNSTVARDCVSCTNSEGQIDPQYLDEEYLIEDDDETNPNDESNDTAEVKCNLCSQYLKLNSLQQHMEEIHFNYKCPNCERKYYNKSQLQKHLRCAHLKSMNLKCPFCPVTLKNKYNYQQHMFIHSSTAVFKCPFENCGKSFKHINTLKQHEKIHKNRNRRECPYCHEKVTRLQTHILTHSGDRPFICEICGRTYLTKQKLNVHVAMHSQSGFLCQICSSTFKSVYTLDKHRKTIHTSAVYPCPGCDKTYNRKDNMISHMKKAHRELVVSKRKS